MLKRCVSLVLVVVLLAAFTLACSSAPSPAGTAAPAGAAQQFPLPGWPREVVAAGGYAGSTLYMVNSALMAMVSKYLKVPGIPIQTGGSVRNTEALRLGETDLALTMPDVGFYAFQGIESWKGKKFPVRWVAGDYFYNWVLIVRADSGIKTISDLKGKVVYGDTLSSALGQIAEKGMFELYGLNPATDLKFQPTDTIGERTAALREKRCDVIGTGGSHPVPLLTDLAESTDVVFLPVDRAKLDEFIKKYAPFYVSGITLAGSYKGVKQDVLCPAASQTYAARVDMPDSLVYEICKLIYEPAHRAEWEAYYPACKEFQLADVNAASYPVHAGAIKYLKEKGVWTAALEKRNQDWLAIAGETK